MKLSIRLKLLIGFALLFLLASMVQGFVYFVTKNYVLRQFELMQEAEVNRGAAAIDRLFSELTAHSRGLAQVYQNKPQDFTESATYLISTNNYIKRISVLTNRGREIEKIDIFGQVPSDKLSYEVASEQFAKAIEGTTAFSKVYYSEEGQAPQLDLYTPIYGAKASLSGVLKMKVNLYQVRDELANIKLGEHGFVYVVDDEGRLIAHESQGLVLERPNLLSRKVIANALADKKSSVEDLQYINEKKELVTAKAVKVQGLNWIAVLEQPYKEAYGFVTILRQLFFITFAGSTVLMLFIALYLSENLTHPIRKLQQSAQEIESGQSKKTVIITSGDEIESLSKSFASMTDLLMQRDQWLEKITLKLNDTNEKLKQMDKLKDDFVSLASHELRTPMTAIKSYLSMTLDGMGGQLTDKQRYYIDRAYVAVDWLIKMVNDMLNISRIESGRITVNIQKVDIDQLVQQIFDDIKPRAEELGVNVVIDRRVPPPPVLADADKIKEVVFNLIGNALKFTPKDGKITVQFNTHESMVEVIIQDTGSGIEPEDIPKLFQKFGLVQGSYGTNQATLGTGLGLYICRLIIELHEGKIGVNSDGRGKGSTFTFSLKQYNEEDMQRLSRKFAHQAGTSVDLIHSQV